MATEETLQKLREVGKKLREARHASQQSATQVFSGGSRAESSEPNLSGTKGESYLSVHSSEGVTREESSDRGNTRTVSQPGSLESKPEAAPLGAGQAAREVCRYLISLNPEPSVIEKWTGLLVEYRDAWAAAETRRLREELADMKNLADARSEDASLLSAGMDVALEERDSEKKRANQAESALHSSEGGN